MGGHLLVEAQVLMAGGAGVDAEREATAIMLAGWEFHAGASTVEDTARVGLLLAMSLRLVDQIMLMVARKRRSEGDELLSPLVNNALAVAAAVAELLAAAVAETDDQTTRAPGCRRSSNSCAAWLTYWSR